MSEPTKAERAAIAYVTAMRAGVPEAARTILGPLTLLELLEAVTVLGACFSSTLEMLAAEVPGFDPDRYVQSIALMSEAGEL